MADVGAPAGVQTSYDFSAGVKINMDEAIYMLSPMDTPLLTGFGSDGNTVLASQSVDERIFYWMDEEALLPRSTLAATLVTAGTVITVASGHQQRFSTGDIVKIMTVGKDDLRRITGYGTTADTLLCDGSAYNGTISQHVTNAEVVSLGTALAEGADPEAARSVDRSERNNVTQIFGPTKVSITRTEQGRAKYGISDELAHQMYLRMQENAISREQAFLYGQTLSSATTTFRTTGGVDQYITTNNDATRTEMTVANIELNMVSCYDAGGLPDQLWVNPKTLKDLNPAEGTLHTVNTDTMRGVRRVQYVSTEYGDVDIMRNRWVHRQHAFLVSREGITRRVFDPMFTEKLAKTGDSENWMLVCEEGLEVKGQTHMAKFTNLTDYA